jgi:dihydroorotate dehydrogenase (fumarate)
MRLPMLWIAVLSGRTRASFAASTGVYGVTGVVKYLLAGADVVMTTAALPRNGIGHVATRLHDLERWMEEREIASLDDTRAMMSWLRSWGRSVYSRSNCLRLLEHYAAS